MDEHERRALTRCEHDTALTLLLLGDRKAMTHVIVVTGGTFAMRRSHEHRAVAARPRPASACESACGVQ